MIPKICNVENRDSITREDGDTLVRFNLYLNTVLLDTDGWESWDGTNKTIDIDPEVGNLFVVRSVWLVAGETTITQGIFVVIGLPTGINIVPR
jgi:hypothetical protein